MLFILAWLTAANQALLEAYQKAEKEIIHLDEASFKTETQQDSLVFFGAKWCKHCQALTPEWLKLQKWQETDASKDKLKLRKVECTENESLCSHILGFPTVYWYSKGEKKNDYECKEKTFEELKGCVNYVMSNLGTSKGIQGEIEKLNKLVSLEIEANPLVNPDGETIHLDESTFAKTTKQPWLVMFHAPWCGHCQQFGPIFESLAPQLRQRVNVAKVDCTKNREICNKFQIRGFPTIGFINEPLDYVEFTGRRNAENVKQFALQQVTTASIKPVTLEELETAIKDLEVGFFYAYDFETDKLNSDLLTALKKFKGKIGPVYVCPDKKSLQVLGASKLPAFVNSKDMGLVKLEYNGVMIGELANQQLTSFILKNKFPLVPKLDESTQKHLLKSDMLVLGIFDADSHKKEVAEFRKLVKEYHDESRKPVQFAWIDFREYEKYIKSVYHIRSNNLPTVVVANPKEEVYYSQFKNKDYFGISKPLVFSALQEIEAGNLTPKSTRGFIGNIWITIKPIFKFLFASLLGWIILFSAIAIFTFSFIRKSDYVELADLDKSK